MKKLFLTSGIILCMACPAFAATDITPAGTGADCTYTYLDSYTGPVNYEAKWTAVNYAINFAKGQAGSHTDANYITGSTASVSPVTFDDTSITLTSNGFSARGYHFDHWSSPVNLETGASSSTNYNNGATLTGYGYEGSPTLTAQWAANTYTVSYVAGTHGSGSSTDTNGATFDTNYTIKGMGTGSGQSGVTPDTGYHFVKWTGSSTDVDYSAPANGYTETQTITPYTIDGPLTLTAQFAPDSFTVTYNKGDHAAANVNNFTDTDGATYDADYTARTFSDATNNGGAGMTAADGYTFRGWSTVEHPTVTENAGVYTVSNAWTGETPWKRTADLTVYAAYTANSYQITFTCGTKPSGATSNITQGGNAGSAVSVTYASAYSALPATAGTCELPGYHFNGWSCGNGISASGGTYNVAGNTECAATWTPNTINLTWYNDSSTNNGTAITLPQGSNAGSCTYDGTLNLPAQPEKNGYTFNGWTVRSTSSNN